MRDLVSQTKVISPTGAELPRVTISMGIAPLVHGEQPAEMLKAADASMYEAKRSGRNRVMVATRAR